jgi:hypothetical protein
MPSSAPTGIHQHGHEYGQMRITDLTNETGTSAQDNHSRREQKRKRNRHKSTKKREKEPQKRDRHRSNKHRKPMKLATQARELETDTHNKRERVTDRWVLNQNGEVEDKYLRQFFNSYGILMDLVNEPTVEIVDLMDTDDEDCGCMGGHSSWKCDHKRANESSFKDSHASREFETLCEGVRHLDTKWPCQATTSSWENCFFCLFEIP